jgi:hypothetical protein
MKKYFKYFFYLYVLIGFSTSIAGSYDDFMSALHFDRPDVVENLLARGFDPNTPNEKGEAALLVAIQSESSKSALVLAKHPQTRVNTQTNRSPIAANMGDRGSTPKPTDRGLIPNIIDRWG